MDLWNRIAEAGWLVLAQPEVLVRYRIHTGSVTTTGFSGSRIKYEWLRSCLRLRRRGESELSEEEFRQIWDRAPFIRKLNRSRKTLAKASYRAAGYAFIDGRMFQAFKNLAIAAMMQPSYTIPRILDQQRFFR